MKLSLRMVDADCQGRGLLSLGVGYHGHRRRVLWKTSGKKGRDHPIRASILLPRRWWKPFKDGFGSRAGLCGKIQEAGKPVNVPVGGGPEDAFKGRHWARTPGVGPIRGRDGCAPLRGSVVIRLPLKRGYARAERLEVGMFTHEPAPLVRGQLTPVQTQAFLPQLLKVERFPSSGRERERLPGGSLLLGANRGRRRDQHHKTDDPGR